MSEKLNATHAASLWQFPVLYFASLNPRGCEGKKVNAAHAASAWRFPVFGPEEKPKQQPFDEAAMWLGGKE